jgi:hypothetical protein
MTGGIIFIRSADQGLWRVEKVPMSREKQSERHRKVLLNTCPSDHSFYIQTNQLTLLNRGLVKGHNPKSV